MNWLTANFGKVTTAVGSLIAIGIGVADVWAFHGSFGMGWDTGLIGAGIGALIGSTALTAEKAVAAARAAK